MLPYILSFVCVCVCVCVCVYTSAAPIFFLLYCHIYIICCVLEGRSVCCHIYIHSYVCVSVSVSASVSVSVYFCCSYFFFNA